ncbi:MAG: KamA family radical SAM protein [Candidatus Heimdallarchaeaceae archaeon]
MLKEKKLGKGATRYKAYTLHNYEEIEQLSDLSQELIEDIRIVGHVLPFKTNNYVINELIDWSNVPNDPLFILNFPVKGMLLPHHYRIIREAIEQGKSKKEIEILANKIRMELNPHPAGQKEYNVPKLNGEPLFGVQHKYRETVLFFPSQGQTCHAYCTFCFRWPQFVSSLHMKFASKEVEGLIEYLQQNPYVQDVLITGGDPMIMKADLLERYIMSIVEANIKSIQTIRIGTKTLSYWPYRYLTDSDSDHILQIFEETVESGLHLAIMAHFNHPRELTTEAVVKATKKIRKVGAEIRTQSPVLNHINASPSVWAEMWKRQVKLGMIPYYMFIARDTGARHFFSVPLIKAWSIFNRAYRKVSGTCRTVRGPSMSATPGKVEVVGPTHIHNQKALVLRFIQARNPKWVGKPFFAKYDTKATWLNELEPLFAREFFYEKELPDYLAPFSEINIRISRRSEVLHELESET